MMFATLVELCNHHHNIFSLSTGFCSLNITCLGVFYLVCILLDVL